MTNLPDNTPCDSVSEHPAAPETNVSGSLSRGAAFHGSNPGGQGIAEEQTKGLRE